MKEFVMVMAFISALRCLSSCQPRSQTDMPFEEFKRKFTPMTLPFRFSNLDSLWVFDDTVMIEVTNGWEYVKSQYPTISKSEITRLPPEKDLKPGMRINYQAVYSFEGNGSYYLLLFFKKIDADNEHEIGLGKHLVLATFEKNGTYIDSKPFAFSVYNLSDQTGFLSQDFVLKISRLDREYEHNRRISLMQEFNIDSAGLFHLIRSDTTVK